MSFSRLFRIGRSQEELYGDRKNPHPVSFSDVHGASPGFLAISLLIVAVLIHVLCCNWSPGGAGRRAKIVGSVYAGEAFIYANQVGDPVYDTHKAALFGLAIPGALASCGLGVLGFLCYRKVRSRRRALVQRDSAFVPSDHLRARASRRSNP